MPRQLQLALFFASVLWIVAANLVASSAAHGLTTWLVLPEWSNAVASVMSIFLMLLGFRVLQSISGSSTTMQELAGLPRRSTAREEWLTGAALGWGMVVVAILPMALAGTLHVHFVLDSHNISLVLVSLVTLLSAALAEEIAFRGYSFGRLIEVMGPGKASFTLAIGFGLIHVFNPGATLFSTLTTVTAGLLFALAWLRTRALWLGWGMHFAWNASLGILFGLPVSGLNTFSTVVMTRAVGSHWLTGGAYGPEAALFTVPTLLAGIAVLYAITGEYAWQYARAPIIAAGIPMDIPAPAAHTAMEAAATAAPPALVQILPSTPQGLTATPPPASGSDEHN
ncbi:MAG: CPBP family intramembrane metalloprotease [Acidobacteriota bacterium]|nr:CPBP family intramembrane metalloprotease [Acidobacteriota bacterium]